MSDIKETKEALVALVTLFDFLAERLKDGAGIDDLIATYSKLTSDTVFIKKLKDGYEGKEKIHEELKKLDIDGVTELGYAIAPEIITLLLKLRKEK